MRTPIADFVRAYANSGSVRLHMPGHKGKAFLGCEPLDITEINGADVLYSAHGIIDESERNASHLFKTAHTYYSTEGSTLAIKAMLMLAMQSRKSDTPPVVLAARNVHRAFISAAALIDFSVEWLYPAKTESLCECIVSADAVEGVLRNMPSLPFAVYITSPDYLGNIADVEGIARVCERHGLPLLVDNAHGAYLAFTSPTLHPIALGAAMCVDSAHKTLPVLTGGAYLHISEQFSRYAENARSALSLFASTSPSYLVLQSLDLCNAYLADSYTERLSEFVKGLELAKQKIRSIGFSIRLSEPLKIVLDTVEFGYTGNEVAQFLRENNIEAEYADEKFVTLMLTPENDGEDISRLLLALASLEKREPIKEPDYPPLKPTEQVISIREAVFSPRRRVNVTDSVGKICADAAISCPPAIPIAISGERITEDLAALLTAYGINEIAIVDC